jgi:hypothetical protein
MPLDHGIPAIRPSDMIGPIEISQAVRHPPIIPSISAIRPMTTVPGIQVTPANYRNRPHEMVSNGGQGAEEAVYEPAVGVRHFRSTW